MTHYTEIRPITDRIPALRQGAKRHYGVHPYFTRRPYNVVQSYILNYTKMGDRVLDPFGGSGVTAIEAFLENRVGIQNDLNPLANFIAQGIVNLHKGNLRDYTDSLRTIEEACKEPLSKISECSLSALPRLSSKLKLKLPRNIPLPRSSDVLNYHDLFTPRQLYSLAVLKAAIDALPRGYARRGMLLAWSATLTKLNKTFLSAEGRAASRGGSSIFSIYRYKVAKTPVELPPLETFSERATNIIDAKIEIDDQIELKERTSGWSGKFETYSEDVDDLSHSLKDTIDYIFTDPPYGGHISYLDLSTLWNEWLGLSPSLAARQKELIVGGELDLQESDYTERLGSAIQSCLRMLKTGRWFSVVFQHWNTAYFEAILASASESGAELKAAISQVGDPVWSMHKKKNSSVLAGELILTFFKSGKRQKLVRNGNFSVDEMVKDILSTTENGKLYGEYLFNRLVIESWKRGSIGSLNISRDEFMTMLEHYGWHYNEQSHYWVKGSPSLVGSTSLFLPFDSTEGSATDD